MNSKIYTICFYFIGDDSLSEVYTEIAHDYYPEFVDAVGKAFEGGRRFFINDIGIDFSNVKYYYIFSEEV